MKRTKRLARRTPLRRTTRLRRRRAVGRNALARIRAGGALAKGRPAASAAGYETVRAEVRARSAGQCEVVLHGVRCRRPAVEMHHVPKRSQGAPDHPDHAIDICRSCHRWTDEPYSGKRGRLVLTRLGGGQFACRVIRAASKWEARALMAHGPIEAPSSPM